MAQVQDRQSERGSEVFIASGVQPDTIRVWYEVPDQVAVMLRETIDQDETFVECLMRLLLEREGTYRQVVRENRGLRRELAEIDAGEGS